MANGNNFVSGMKFVDWKGTTSERPSPEIASELRTRYKAIAGTKRKAAEVLKSSNSELAAEVFA